MWPTIRELAGEDWDCRLAFLKVVPPAGFQEEVERFRSEDHNRRVIEVIVALPMVGPLLVRREKNRF